VTRLALAIPLAVSCVVPARALPPADAPAPEVAASAFVPDESAAEDFARDATRETAGALGPAQTSMGPMVLLGRTWTSAGPGYTLRVQRLDDAERTAYIEHTSGERIDPFRAPPDREARYETFLLQVENRTDGPASFNPQDCWLVAGSREVIYPIGLDDLGTMYRQLEGDLPAAYDRIRPALLDQAATLAPGESTAGLLVYPAPKQETKRFRIELQLTLPTGDVVRARAPYRRAK
jgi:hypothetical protein